MPVPTKARMVAKQCWLEFAWAYKFTLVLACSKNVDIPILLKKNTDMTPPLPQIFQICLAGLDFSPILCDLDGYPLGINMRSPNTFFHG